MGAVATLDAPLRTLRAFREPSADIQRVAQVLLLLLGKRKPSALGPWQWDSVRAALRDRDLLPLLAAFEPRAVDEATGAAAAALFESLSAERVVRASGPVAQVFRWCAVQLARVEASLNGGAPEETQGPGEPSASGEEDEYGDDDFDEEGSERQIGDEEGPADRALWRQQQASTVLSGDFDYSILDGAMVSMVVKFLGAGHSALTLQAKALAALTTRLQSAPAEVPEKPKGGSDDSDDSEDDDEPETLGAVVTGLCEGGGVQRCISLLGASSLSARTAAAQLLAALVRQSPEAAGLFKACGGGLADEAGCFDALQRTENDGSVP